MEIESYIRT